MKKNPLIELENLGQSVWLDYISRDLLDKGELRDLIVNDHLKGVTSNPIIFEKAIAKTDDYNESILSLSAKGIHSPVEVFEHLAVRDIRDACDLLKTVYEKSGGTDGFASLEVSPHLAFDTEGTVEEGKRLWHAVNRPNLMIKVPGTREGQGAIRKLIAEGINVNVTLLFSVQSYKDAAHAYLLGLKDRDGKGQSISNVASVASFFISRIDSKVDQQLEEIMSTKKASNAEDLLGQTAIANAKIAYLAFKEIYQSDLAKDLVSKGAHPQRLLWASTSTKNKRYSDVLYIESLIGDKTVNTVPLDTLKAFKDHGHAANTLMRDADDAHNVMERIRELGIDFSSVCQTLEQEGVKLFADAFDQLMQAVKTKLSQMKK